MKADRQMVFVDVDGSEPRARRFAGVESRPGSAGHSYLSATSRGSPVTAWPRRFLGRRTRLC